MIPTGWLYLECLACMAMGWLLGRAERREARRDERGEERRIS